jgi:hypothetical protein
MLVMFRFKKFEIGVDDDRLMNVISESVKLVMEEVIAVFFFPSNFAVHRLF